MTSTHHTTGDTTDLDTTVTATRYQYTRITDIAGSPLRLRIVRDVDRRHSFASAEYRLHHTKWDGLTEIPAADWWDSTPDPAPGIDPHAVLGPVAERLLDHARAVLAPSPDTITLSGHLYDALAAMLATQAGCNAECQVTTEDIAWAKAYGGRLHVIEHDDGTVTFTQAHRDECPFITTNGTDACDDECYFEHPYDRQLRLGL